MREDQAFSDSNRSLIFCVRFMSSIISTTAASDLSSVAVFAKRSVQLKIRCLFASSDFVSSHSSDEDF
jgi:hypothetical protein